MKGLIVATNFPQVRLIRPITTFSGEIKPGTILSVISLTVFYPDGRLGVSGCPIDSVEFLHDPRERTPSGNLSPVGELPAVKPWGDVPLPAMLTDQQISEGIERSKAEAAKRGEQVAREALGKSKEIASAVSAGDVRPRVKPAAGDQSLFDQVAKVESVKAEAKPRSPLDDLDI